MDHTATVGKIYEAFGKGDIPAILEHVSDDVKWEHWEKNFAQEKGLSYLQAQTGKAGVGKFFASLAAFEFRDFKVLGLMAGGNKVVGEISIELKIKANDKILRDEELHLWTFDDKGKVVAFRHYLDTAKHIDASGA